MACFAVVPLAGFDNLIGCAANFRNKVKTTFTCPCRDLDVGSIETRQLISEDILFRRH